MATNGRGSVGIALLIAGATAIAYAGVWKNEFVSFDDLPLIVQNPRVATGLSLDNVKWAFSLEPRSSYWHPLTSVSWMLDAHLHGLDPRAFHLVNVALHGLNALLLFLLLQRATSHRGRSATVALLFAVHPLNVEAVAWAIERKTVLALFFGLLALHAWFSYARRRRLGTYLAALALAALSLLSKPMLVTLPFLLVLLHLWPLGRGGSPGAHGTEPAGPRREGLARLAAEVLPFLVLSAVSVALTLASLLPDGTIERPWGLRISNAVASYPWYLARVLLPSGGLGVFYPWPAAVPLWKPLAGAALLASVTLAAVRLRGPRSAVVVGWLWFVVALVPMLGLVHRGLWPRVADRFAYLPMIGLWVAVVWGVASASAYGRRAERALVVAAVAAVVAGVVITRGQVAVWRDSVTLYAHAVRVAPDSPEMLYNLGTELGLRKRYAEAEEALERSRRLEPRASRVHNQLGNVYLFTNRLPQALAAYRTAVHLDPRNARAVFNLALLYERTGRTAESAAAYRQFLAVAPADLEHERRWATARASGP